MKEYYQASCLCGGINFEVAGFSHRAANCYYSMCRKFHDSAFGTLVGVSELRWKSGQALLKEFTGQNGTVRTFCERCGASVGFRVKACWSEIEGSVPQFKEGRVE